jgi:hypothetical protein
LDFAGNTARHGPIDTVDGNSLAERNRRAIWGAMNTSGEDAAISRDSLPLASRGFRVVERV